MRQVSEILASINESLREADRVLWEAMEPDSSIKLSRDDKCQIRYFLDRAFLQTMFFLEAQGLLRMLAYAEETYRAAKNDILANDISPDNEPYLVWDGELRQFLSAIESTLGEPGSTTVMLQLTGILKNCQHAITAPCFPEPPQNERQVHERIEVVLSCAFPDLVHKPSISKHIKNFEPDTGLPSIRTLIEYKFISSLGEAKRVAEEVLADTRGYVSKEWDRFFYVIYETRRIKSEYQWSQLLRTSGLGADTKVIVLSGEPVAKRRGHGVARKPRSAS